MTVQVLLLLTSVLTLWPGEAIAGQADAAKDAAAKDAPDKDTTVTVTAQKKPVTKKLDKTVYSTAGNPKADSGTALDVLQSTPTLSVSADGQISVKGNANVTVLVNGKPQAVMSGDNRAIALQTMAGSDIASIEVITNPSAAYNANGGAIVNIVLKKDRKAGAHGTVRANMSDQGLWNMTLSGDYSKNKLSVHASVALRRDGTLKYRQSDVNWRDPLSGAYGENRQSSEVFIRRMTQTASAGLDYDLSDRDSLSASASYNFRRSRPLFDEFHQDDTAGVPMDAYHRISHGPNQQSDDALNLGYTHQDGDTLVKASLQHSDTITLVDKSFENVFVSPPQAPNFDRVSNRTARHLDQASLDYARPITAWVQISLGLDYQRDANAIDAYYATLDPLTGHETVNPATTHGYQVVQSQGAGYVTTQLIWGGRWEALIGARFEAMATRLTAANALPVHGADYHSLNPSLHVKYTLDAHHSLTLSYRQSLQRPDPRNLDPFVTYGDAQNLYSGNPALRPQELKSLELSYDMDQDGLSRTLSAFYRKTSDTVVDSRRFTADNVLLTTQQNAGKGLSTGAGGSLDWRPVSSVHISTDASLYYVALDTVDMGVPVHQSGVSYGLNLGLDYGRGIDTFGLDAHANGPGITPQGQYSATNGVNLTWKRHMTKRLDLSLSASDILDGAKQGYSTHTSTFSQSGYNHFVARRVYIGLVYKLG